MASPAQAQSWLNLPSFQHWNLNSLVSNEQARINAGRANGSLTHDEANRLQKRLDDINALKWQLSRDGVSRADQQLIDQQLDQLSQDVYRESNDRQMLGSKPWGWSQSYTPNNSNWHYGHWDNGRWVSKNNWNQYDGWKNKNWKNKWNHNNNNNNNNNRNNDNRNKNWRDHRADGQSGRGVTHVEASNLNAKERELNNMQRRYSADGNVDAQEAQNLQNVRNEIRQDERNARRN